MNDIKIQNLSYDFSLDIIKLVRLIPKDTAGYILGRQLIRSGTSIGANIEEGQGAGSKKDFIFKMNIAKKEARETKYWLRLIADSSIVDKNKMAHIIKECSSIINILTAIVKTSTANS
ncbi:MAG: four helix bundle protein [bacterium]